MAYKRYISIRDKKTNELKAKFLMKVIDKELLQRKADGQTVVEICEQMKMKKRTVENRFDYLRGIFGCKDITALCVESLRLNLIK